MILFIDMEPESPPGDGEPPPGEPPGSDEPPAGD